MNNATQVSTNSLSILLWDYEEQPNNPKNVQRLYSFFQSKNNMFTQKESQLLFKYFNTNQKIYNYLYFVTLICRAESKNNLAREKRAQMFFEQWLLRGFDVAQYTCTKENDYGYTLLLAVLELQKLDECLLLLQNRALAKDADKLIQTNKQ